MPEIFPACRFDSSTLVPSLAEFCLLRLVLLLEVCWLGSVGLLGGSDVHGDEGEVGRS
jgi:hypothetical protein